MLTFICLLRAFIDHENEEFDGRAFDGGFKPIKPCIELGTHLTSLAAGRYAGVAKNANINRYIYYRLYNYSYVATYNDIHGYMHVVVSIYICT